MNVAYYSVVPRTGYIRKALGLKSWKLPFPVFCLLLLLMVFVVLDLTVNTLNVLHVDTTTS